jgi:hypothetical protein
MKSIAELTAGDFKPLTGETFDLDGHELVLLKVEENDAPHPSLPAPMCLFFSGPDGLVVAGIHTLSHEAIGAHQLLVHRVTDPEGARFEIIFG